MMTVTFFYFIIKGRTALILTCDNAYIKKQIEKKIEKKSQKLEKNQKKWVHCPQIDINSVKHDDGKNILFRFFFKFQGWYFL